jgi:hypothetical protein
MKYHFMKNLLFVFIFSLLLSTVAAQSTDNYIITFDTSTNLNFLTIDTLSNPDNIWQIGPPDKAEFTQPYSVPNVLVTDTASPYPANSTSSFTLYSIMTGLGVHEYMGVAGAYWVNTDTLDDFGTIEVSFDSGNTWIDIFTDPVYSQYVSWDWGMPSFTGNSNGWQSFFANIYLLFYQFNVQPGDTVMYKFTFTSDGNPSNKDGLMFDDLLSINGTLLGVPEMNQPSEPEIFPNPAGSILNFKFHDYAMSEVSIWNARGKMVQHNSQINSSLLSMDVSHLNPGCYFYRVIDASGKFTFGKFLKE